jgi:hypothetical protein
MHPELMRSLVREHRAVLLEQQQYRRKRSEYEQRTKGRTLVINEVAF